MQSTPLETALSAAFFKAGYRDPRQRLEELMDTAIQNGKGLFDPSKDWFVRSLHDSEHVAQLLWELARPLWNRLISELFTQRLNAARQTNSAAKSSMPSGHYETAAERNGDGKAVLPLSQDQKRDAAYHRPDAQEKAATSMPQGQNTGATLGRSPTRPAFGAAGAVHYELFLDRIVINGVALRRQKAGIALTWASQRAVDNRAVILLTKDLPADAIVGDHISDAAAEQALELAKSWNELND